MPPLRPSRSGSHLLSRVAESLGVRSATGESVVVSGVSLDSRSVQPGDVYAALPGLVTHGAKFVPEAVAAGAVAVLTDEVGAALVDASFADSDGGLDRGSVPVLIHPDPRAVLGDLSAFVYGTSAAADEGLCLIGITGTNGKTTTAYLIQSALVALGHRIGLIGTVETRIGDEHVRSTRTTPEAPDLHALLAVMLEKGVDVCVMEVSSHALRMHRVDGVRYDLAIFTNLSRDHLDFHADMEDYYAAKASLFTPERATRALVCVDDEWGARLAAETPLPVQSLTTVPGQQADWVVTAQGDAGAFRLRGVAPDGQPVELDLVSALPGDFNITNTAMAAVSLLMLGETVAEVERAVLTDPHVPGRMERVVAGPGADDSGDPQADLRAVVDYAHTPEAIRAALDALRPTTPGALVVVTGAGGDRDRDKRTEMGAAAAGLADVVVVTDDNPRSEDPAVIRAAVLAGARAASGERAGAVEILEVGDRRAAIRRAVALARASGPGATVAIVGKGHETGQEIAGEVHPFDDRVELREALQGTSVMGEESPA